MIYFRMYVQDYLAATARLSMLEHGAYMLLLAYYYADEKPLPADPDELYLMVRAMTPADRKAVDKVLRLYFALEPDGYHNVRADHEIAAAKTARENGGYGGRPKTTKGTGSETGSKTGSETEQETGSETGSETQSGTGEGGGSGQPFSLSTKTSLSTTQPSNLSPKTVAAPAAPSPRRKAKREAPPTAPAWEAYRGAYANRYGTDPVRNAKVNAHFARFVQRVGAAEAPEIAAFYLTHSRAAYVASKHDSRFLDMDAEGLRTEWATGQRVTQTQAAQADRTQATGGVFQRLIDEAQARERIA